MQMGQNNYIQKIKDLIQQLDAEKLKNQRLEEKIETLKLITDKQAKEINLLNEINQKLRNENNSLKNGNNDLNPAPASENQLNQSIIDEMNKLKDIIIQKDNEINELKLKIPKNNVNMNDIIVINFISTDKGVTCGIPCLQENTFAEVEEKLYQQYEEFRNTNNLLLFKGNKILRFKKIKENNIHNGDTIELVKQK